MFLYLKKQIQEGELAHQLGALPFLQRTWAPSTCVAAHKTSLTPVSGAQTHFRISLGSCTPLVHRHTLRHTHTQEINLKEAG